MDRSSPAVNDSLVCDVYYDGACPLCRAEIDLYRRLGSRARFHDLTTDGERPPGVSRDAALARFHVRDGHGRVHTGARAFATLWQASPGAWRILGHIVACPPFVWLAEGLYRVFLPLRPWLQRLVRRRQRNA